MIKTAVIAVALLWPGAALAVEAIPCWKAQALLTWTGGNEAKAEALARQRGYTKAQIAEVRKRCGL